MSEKHLSEFILHAYLILLKVQNGAELGIELVILLTWAQIQQRTNVAETMILVMTLFMDLVVMEPLRACATDRLSHGMPNS